MRIAFLAGLPDELFDGLPVVVLQLQKLDSHGNLRQRVHDHARGFDQVPGGEVEADDDFGAGVEGLAGVNQQPALADVFGAAEAGGSAGLALHLRQQPHPRMLARNPPLFRWWCRLWSHVPILQLSRAQREGQ